MDPPPTMEPEAELAKPHEDPNSWDDGPLQPCRLLSPPNCSLQTTQTATTTPPAPLPLPGTPTVLTGDGFLSL